MITKGTVFSLLPGSFSIHSASPTLVGTAPSSSQFPTQENVLSRCLHHFDHGELFIYYRSWFLRLCTSARPPLHLLAANEPQSRYIQCSGRPPSSSSAFLSFRRRLSLPPRSAFLSPSLVRRVRLCILLSLSLSLSGSLAPLSLGFLQPQTQLGPH